METILEPKVCATCRQFEPTPNDGQWRWAKSGKVFDTLEQATVTAVSLNQRDNTGFEFRAALDEQGRPRIASRRKAAA